MSLTMPQMSISAAFGNGPFDASPTWTDITQWIKQASVKRGRQHELQRFQAGICSLTLNNQDGRFSQWNTASPYAGNLVPATPIKFTAKWGATTYPVFYGSVDSWTPAYGKVKSEQVVSCTDAMKLLSLPYLDKDAYTPLVLSLGGYPYLPLTDPAGSAFARVLEAPGPIVPYAAYPYGNMSFGAPGPFLGGAPSAAAFNAFGYIGLSPPAPFSTATLWIKTTVMGQSMLGDSGLGVGTNAGTGRVFATATGIFGLTGTSNVCDGNWHFIVVTVDATSATLRVDGVTEATGAASGGSPTLSLIGADALSGAPAHGWIGSIAQVALFPNVLTDAQLLNLYQVVSAGWATPQYSGQRIAAVLALYGWPIGLQNIATGLTQVQAATSSFTQTTALAYIQQLEATEQGQFFVDEAGLLTYLDRHYILTAPAATTSNATFASDNNPAHFHYTEGSIIPAADDLDLWTDVLGSRQGGVNQQASNVFAADRYGWRSLSGFTGLLQENDNEVQALCQWLLTHYDAPLSRVRQMIVDNTADAGANFPQMLGRKLMDRVTVDWKPLDATSAHFIQDSLIESIQHDVTQDSWKTTYGLSPAETQSYFVLDDPALGLLDANRLGY